MGQAGHIIYNSDWHAAQYCNGVTWVTMGQAGVPTPLNNGLVGWWRLDDGSSGTTPTTAADSSGNGNTGTLTNSPVCTTSGKISNALTFNGTNQYVSYASAMSHSAPESFSFWAKTTASGSNAWVFGLGFYTECYFTSAGQMNCQADGSTAPVASATNDGKWHHYVYSATATTQSLYIDGAFCCSANGGVNSGTDTFSIGASVTRGLAGTYFPGTIDDIRIYNRALSAAEIAALYNWGTLQNAPTSGLVGWWKLDDGSSGTTPTTAADSSGNNNTGTLTNGPTWTTGKISNALSFNGTNNYVSTTYTLPSFPLSLCAWVNYNAATSNTSVIIAAGGLMLYAINDVANADYPSVYDNNGTLNASVDSIRAGAWNHICGRSSTRTVASSTKQRAISLRSFCSVLQN